MREILEATFGREPMAWTHRPKPDELFNPGTQNARLYRRLLQGPVSNVEIVHDHHILNSTGRISEIRGKLRDYLIGVRAERDPSGNGVFVYSLRG